MSKESLNSRDKPFKAMLLAVSKQLDEQHVEQLQYLTECRCTSKPLELLTALRNKGMFSPVHCAPLEELLKKIDRYDVAGDVRNKYSSLYPDQKEEAAQQELRQCTERKRSSTDPTVMTGPTPAGDIESKSVLADTGAVYQEHKMEHGIVPPNLTLLRNGNENRGATSLDDVRPMCSTPTTPPSASYSTQAQHRDPFSLAQSQPSSTNISMRSISQSSQDPYSSYSSSTSSHVSSSSSLLQGNITDAVLERTSVMLLHQVTAGFQRYPNSSQAVGNTQFGYQYGHSRSFHEPHVTYPEPQQLEPSAQTLPRLNTAAPTQPAIQGPTISEIYSDPEEVEKERAENRSKKGISQKRQIVKSSTEGIHEGNDYDDTTLRPKQKTSDSPEIERSRTPRVGENPLPDQSDSRDLDVTVADRKLQPTVLGKGSAGDDIAHLNVPKPLSKEKNWRKKLSFFTKNKSKRNSSPNSFTWKILRDDLSKPIWTHDEKRCITRSPKLEIDANLGRRNPKLSFQLYPYGESEDSGEFSTIIVRIYTSDKCLPLPASSKVHVSLVVRTDSSEKDTSCILQQCSVEEHLDMGFFRIRKVVRHDQLMKSHSKYIYFDVEATCSGVDTEGRARERLSTF